MPRPPCFENVRSKQIFEQLERTPDISRGETRLASEALIAVLEGDEVPEPVMRRALAIADILARG